MNNTLVIGHYKGMDNALTVSQFVDVVNAAFEALGPLVVEGEVIDFRIIHNKWVTFSLKDEESTVPCFMTVWQLKTQIEDGMLVKVVGKPSLRNKGFFSFVLQTVQPSGEGALKRAFDLLQQKLAAEGLFAAERKRPLPRFPQHIALITSRDAAAYTDIIKVLQERQGGLTISFIHTQVQGEDAPRQIIEALSAANTKLENLDAVVLARGGGSLEDLQAFNDESVVRAVAGSRAPIIVGVGHERDITLAELAADIRASTPSNAAELLVRSRQELEANILGMHAHLRNRFREAAAAGQSDVLRSVRVLQTRITSTTSRVTRQVDTLFSMRKRFIQEAGGYSDRVTTQEHHIRHAYQQSLKNSQQNIHQLYRVLQSLSPQNVLRRGFSITRQNGKVIKKPSDVIAGDIISTTLMDGEVISEIK